MVKVDLALLTKSKMYLPKRSMLERFNEMWRMLDTYETRLHNSLISEQTAKSTTSLSTSRVIFEETNSGFCLNLLPLPTFCNCSEDIASSKREDYLTDRFYSKHLVASASALPTYITIKKLDTGTSNRTTYFITELQTRRSFYGQTLALPKPSTRLTTASPAIALMA